MAPKEIDPRHKILKKPQIVHDAKTRVLVCQANQLCYAVNVHSSCVCNEYKALTNRHLVDRSSIKFNRALWMRVARETIKYYPKNLKKVSTMEVINCYKGGKKAAYLRAAENLRVNGYQEKFKVVSMFVKPDRYPEDDCVEKDPRAIQYRKMEFNLALSRYIKAFEHEIYATLTMGVVSQTRVIAKGLNNYERAELMLDKDSYFSQPVYLLLDHSRFDSTINQTHLRTTHKKYQRAFRSNWLQKLLNAQLVNKGFSKNGIVYRAKGTRMSGDPDTGCGNTVVNLDCLIGFLSICGIRKYDLILDGDDSVLWIEKTDLSKIRLEIFEQLGFMTKCEMVYDIIDVEFCQCKIIRAQRPVLVRNPLRMMSHTQVSRKIYPRHHIKHWLSGVGLCEMSSAQGIPVSQAYGAYLFKQSAKQIYDDDTRWKMELLNIQTKEIEVTAQARLDYWQAWGVPISLQLLLETSFPVVGYSDNKTHENVTAYWSLFSTYESLPKHSGSVWWRGG